MSQLCFTFGFFSHRKRKFPALLNPANRFLGSIRVEMHVVLFSQGVIPRKVRFDWSLLATNLSKICLQNGSDSSFTESTQSPHTVFKRLLFSVGNHISDSGSNTRKTAAGQLLRDARADERAAGLERIACPRPKGYCWLRQRVNSRSNFKNKIDISAVPRFLWSSLR